MRLEGREDLSNGEVELRTANVDWVSVNQPFDPERFSYKSFGARNGTKVKDQRREGRPVTFLVEEIGAPSALDVSQGFDSSEAAVNLHNWPSMLVIVCLNVAAVVVLCVYLYMRRVWRGGTSGK